MRLSKTLLFIMFYLYSTGCFSQEKKLFIANKGGINLSTAKLDDPEFDTHLKKGICSGWSFGWGVGKHILILIEGAYDQKGYINEIMFTDYAGNPVGSGDVKYSFNYFSIPVSINYTTGKKISFEAGLGFCSSLLLNANFSYPDGLLVDNKSSVHIGIKEDYNKFDPGVFIRAAGNFHINPYLAIFIEGRFTQGISNAAVSGNNNTINRVAFGGAGVRVYFGKSKEEIAK